MQPGSLSIYATIKTYSREAYNLADHLSKNYRRLTISREQLIFNLRCKKNNILPKSLRFQPPLRTDKGFNISRSFGRKYLIAFISSNHQIIRKCVSAISSIQSYLQPLIPSEMFNQLMSTIDSKMSSLKDRTKEKLKEKFNKLI